MKVIASLLSSCYNLNATVDIKKWVLQLDFDIRQLRRIYMRGVVLLLLSDCVIYSSGSDINP